MRAPPVVHLAAAVVHRAVVVALQGAVAQPLAEVAAAAAAARCRQREVVVEEGVVEEGVEGVVAAAALVQPRLGSAGSAAAPPRLGGVESQPSVTLCRCQKQGHHPAAGFPAHQADATPQEWVLRVLAGCRRRWH